MKEKIKELTFDIAEVHHDGIHHMKLAIDKNSNIRHTFCSRCMKCVKWERVNPIDMTEIKE